MVTIIHSMNMIDILKSFSALVLTYGTSCPQKIVRWDLYHHFLPLYEKVIEVSFLWKNISKKKLLVRKLVSENYLKNMLKTSIWLTKVYMRHQSSTVHQFFPLNVPVPEK